MADPECTSQYTVCTRKRGKGRKEREEFERDERQCIAKSIEIRDMKEQKE
jgi:hypothetical protein